MTEMLRPSSRAPAGLLAGTLIILACVIQVAGQSGGVTQSEVSQSVARVRSSLPGDPALTNAVALGQLLIQEKRFAEAAELFGAVLEKKPSDPDALYGAALTAFNLGKPAEAEPLARAAVAATSSNEPGALSLKARKLAADALVLFAVVLAVRGDDSGALQSARQAIKIDHNHFDAQFTLGRALYSAGDLASAVAAFRLAVSLDPANQQALFFLGTTLERSGDIEAALNTYRQLIAKWPQAAQGHLGLGTLLIRRGGAQTEEGIEELKRAIALQPDLYEARVTLGRTLVARGRAAESIAHLVRAAELAPGNPEPYYQLSLAYRRLRQYEKAAEASAAVKRIHESRRVTRALPK